jgi:predicted nucleic acid-binding protein
MRVFIDTSAYYSLLDRDDANHRKGREIWQELIDSDHSLITNNYVVVETTALTQHRLGFAAAVDFQDTFLPLAHIIWIDADLHGAGAAAWRTAKRRRLSLVDCVSFEVCRRLGVDGVFAFDRHFKDQGWNLLSP